MLSVSVLSVQSFSRCLTYLLWHSIVSLALLNRRRYQWCMSIWKLYASARPVTGSRLLSYAATTHVILFSIYRVVCLPSTITFEHYMLRVIWLILSKLLQIVRHSVWLHYRTCGCHIIIKKIRRIRLWSILIEYVLQSGLRLSHIVLLLLLRMIIVLINGLLWVGKTFSQW